MLKNQITTDFIYFISSNFVTISHINYWNQVNSWKNLWKFWNGPLCRNKSGPYLMQHIGRVAKPKLVSRACLRYFQITLIVHDVIVSVHDVNKKILSCDSNYIVDVVMWQKFGNSSISMTEVIITSILYGFDLKTQFLRGGLGSSSIIWDWR